MVRKLLRTGEYIVFIAGIIGLGLQILAGRLLTPTFGSSVFTWGSIIGMFMVMLTVGYHVGGRTSRHASKRNARRIMLAVAYLIAILAFYGETIVEALGTLPLPPQYAALPAVLLLFGPITFLFGMLTPYAVALSGRRRKGEASGQIFTMDTLGSIIGAFAATFLLIPLLPLTLSFVILGILAALGAIMLQRDWRTIGLSGVAIIVLILVAMGAQIDAQQYGGDLLYQTQTPYQRLQVTENEQLRSLWLDGGLQSSMYLDSDEDVYRYTRYFDVPFILTDVETALFLGGGGFTGPKDYVKRGVETTVIELDPGVVEAATTYFEVDSASMDIHVADARTWLRQSNETFDVIIMDAYRKDRVPFHLSTQEFWQLTDERLSDDGVLVVNVISYATGEKSLFFRSMLRTIDSVYPTTYSFSTYEADRLQNIMIIATKTSEVDHIELLRRAADEGLTVEVSRMLGSVQLGDAVLLRDDRAPVDSLIKSILAEEFSPGE